MQDQPSELQIKAIIQRWYLRNDFSLSLNYRKAQYWIKILDYQDWSQVKQLHLGQSNVNDNNLQKITKMNWLSLQQLNLCFNKISRAGAKFLARNWNNLRIFQINNNINLGSEGIKMLIRAQMPNLKQLWVINCSIGDQGCKYLVKGHWQQLQILYTQNNKIGISGMLIVGQNINIKKLKGLYFWGNNNDSISFLTLMSTRVTNYYVDLVQAIPNQQLSITINSIKDTIQYKIQL